MSDATQTQNQTLEQTLNKTDFGHTIYENRKIFIGLILAILLAAAGYAIWKNSQKSEAQEISIKVFEFRTKTWDQAREGKITPAELAKAFENLDKETQMAPVMVPVALDMGKFLTDKGSLAEAESILSKVDTSHPVAAFFVKMQKAVVFERAGKIPEAIAVLESLAKEKDVLMGAKVNLELGRLNLAKGEKGKAKTHLDYVINTYPNDENAKLAKLYLAKLNQ